MRRVVHRSAAELIAQQEFTGPRLPWLLHDQSSRWGATRLSCRWTEVPLQDFRRAEAGLSALQEWMHEHVERLRHDPGDDGLSTVVRGQQGSDALTDDEVVATAMLLLAAARPR